MDSFIRAILTWLKQKVDKLYYRKYHLGNREELIRKTFPGIGRVWTYNELNSLLATMDAISQRQLVNALMSFYWWEVSILHENKNFDAVKEYQGIPIFCSLIEAYTEELNISNSK